MTRMKTRIATALFCLVTAAAAACSPVRSHSAALSTAPFPQYRTFSFADDEGVPGGYTATTRTAQVERRMEPMVTTILESKGYVAADANTKGDVVVTCASGSRKGHRRLTQTSRGLVDDDAESDYVVGAIVIDMYDGKNDGQVWHGAGRAEVNPDAINDALLLRAVTQVLVRFPSRGAPPAGAAAGWRAPTPLRSLAEGLPSPNAS